MVFSSKLLILQLNLNGSWHEELAFPDGKCHQLGRLQNDGEMCSKKTKILFATTNSQLSSKTPREISKNFLTSLIENKNNHSAVLDSGITKNNWTTKSMPTIILAF